VHRILVVLVLAVGVTIAAQATAAPRQAGQKSLPQKGVLHPGKSLAGVKLGDTKARVLQTWGKNYRVCPRSTRMCGELTWYYIYPKGEPLGVAVRFKNEKVVTIFTLGSPSGWRTAQGLLMGQQVERARTLYGALRWSVCIGYGAMSMHRKDSVTSIYTTGEAVYGFALARPSEPVCN
jgi:hypothetical protein